MYEYNTNIDIHSFGLTRLQAQDTFKHNFLPNTSMHHVRVRKNIRDKAVSSLLLYTHL